VSSIHFYEAFQIILIVDLPVNELIPNYDSIMKYFSAVHMSLKYIQYFK